VTTKPYSIWGRYPDRDFARARNRFSDVPGAHYRVRYMPTTRYPDCPYAVVAYDWLGDADSIDANGELREAKK
jgi:hypothetical protein